MFSTLTPTPVLQPRFLDFAGQGLLPTPEMRGVLGASAGVDGLDADSRPVTLRTSGPGTIPASIPGSVSGNAPDFGSNPGREGSTAARPIVLSIAGFDPSAGAGVLADLKTFSAMGVYGMACATALTIQSSTGVRRVQPLDPGWVVETLDCLIEDAPIAAVKVGMLGRHTVSAAVAGWLRRQERIPIILDPVFESSSGYDLLNNEGIEGLRGEWLTLARWITPNLRELGVLAGQPTPATPAETEDTARRLLEIAKERGNADLKIVVTGGHAPRPDDLLMTKAGCRWFAGEWIRTESTHGTGCAFSSALAARIALGDEDVTAVQSAKQYVAEALRAAVPIGTGQAPLNHFWQDHFWRDQI